MAMILGGVDSTGNHLYSIFPHGSTSRLPYTSMGISSFSSSAKFCKIAHERNNIKPRGPTMNTGCCQKVHTAISVL